jgi:hypothetical protein
MFKRLGITLTMAIALVVSGAAAQASTTGKARAAKATSHKRVCKKAKHRRSRHRCRIRRRQRARTAVVSELQQSSATAYGAQVSWPSVPGARSATISVNGSLIDQIAAGGAGSYELRALWPSTNFLITVELDNANGQPVGRYSHTIRTAPRTSAFPRLFAANAFINTPVAQHPALAPNSQAIISQAVTSYASHAALSNNSHWGIPIVNAESQSHRYTVGCRYYGCDRRFGPVQIPAGAQPDSGSDGHLVVLQPNGNELDMWLGQRTSSGWTAGSRWVQSATGPATNCTQVHGCSGANAADFALAAGVVRPEEIAQGHIDHALVITTPDTRQGYIACPATNTDGKHADPNAMPIGAHVQLDPSVNVSALPIPAWQKVISIALQQYGAYVVDTGGTLALYGQSNITRGYNAWAKAGMSADSPSLSGLPWGSLRVLSMTRCGS